MSPRQTVPCLLLLGMFLGALSGFWLRVSWGGDIKKASARKGCPWVQPLPTNLLPLAGGKADAASGQRRRYYVAESTVPDAGAGVFASEDMKAGTAWNVDDRNPGSSLVISREQWHTLVRSLDDLEAAGYNDTGLHKLLEAIRTYAFYCPGMDVALFSLTPSGFINHARAVDSEPQPDTTSTPQHPTGRGKGHRSHRRRQRATLAKVRQMQQPAFSANSVHFGGAEPNAEVFTGCLLSALTRDVRQGEELFEDYRNYMLPMEREIIMPLRR